jgi:glycosyltransferase involved in cell wall biosynthesis
MPTLAETAANAVVVIPGYQEAPRIGAVVRNAARHLPVLVIDDGSTDDTAAVAEAAGATVVRQVPNQGKGAALRVGFRWALAADADAVVTLDADGQHDPAEIPAFLAARAAGAELVVGRRNFRRMPPVRRLSNTLGGLAMSWAVGRSVPDNQSGFRLVGRRLMGLLEGSDEDGFEFEIEMITTAIVQDLPIAWVPIRTIYSGEPSHIRPLAHARHFVRIVRDARRRVRAGARPSSPPATRP